VVLHQVPHHRLKIRSDSQEFGEHADVLTLMMSGQRRTEREAVRQQRTLICRPRSEIGLQAPKLVPEGVMSLGELPTQGGCAISGHGMWSLSMPRLHA